MIQKTIFALGFFDGVHLGHQALLRACAALAAQLDARCAAISFQDHPLSAFRSDPPPLLGGLWDRETLLRRYGVEAIRCLPVTREFMNTPWQDFLQELLDDGAAGFVCGDDFRFGAGGLGNAEALTRFCRERGLPCVVVPEQTLDGVRISSSYIRRQIETGDMATAVRFLGHPHLLTGRVVHGQRLGSRLGFPTANLLLPPGTVVPKFGVYACRCLVKGVSYPAVTNVGTRPTVQGQGVTVEAWILDFAGDLYGQSVTLEFFRFLRPEQPFPSLEALKAQIDRDAEETRCFLEAL